MLAVLHACEIVFCAYDQLNTTQGEAHAALPQRLAPAAGLQSFSQPLRPSVVFGPAFMGVFGRYPCCVHPEVLSVWFSVLGLLVASSNSSR